MVARLRKLRVHDDLVKILEWAKEVDHDDNAYLEVKNHVRRSLLDEH